MTLFEIISIIIAVISIPAFVYGMIRNLNRNMKDLEERRRKRIQEEVIENNYSNSNDKITIKEQRIVLPLEH